MRKYLILLAPCFKCILLITKDPETLSNNFQDIVNNLLLITDKLELNKILIHIDSIYHIYSNDDRFVYLACIFIVIGMHMQRLIGSEKEIKKISCALSDINYDLQCSIDIISQDLFDTFKLIVDSNIIFDKNKQTRLAFNETYSESVLESISEIQFKIDLILKAFTKPDNFCMLSNKDIIEVIFSKAKHLGNMSVCKYFGLFLAQVYFNFKYIHFLVDLDIFHTQASYLLYLKNSKDSFPKDIPCYQKLLNILAQHILPLCSIKKFPISKVELLPILQMLAHVFSSWSIKKYSVWKLEEWFSSNIILKKSLQNDIFCMLSSILFIDSAKTDIFCKSDSIWIFLSKPTQSIRIQNREISLRLNKMQLDSIGNLASLMSPKLILQIMNNVHQFS
jgi:hypothetical protein